EEAIENEKEGTNKTKTWRFKAENVRDFAWASSRKFIWDAQGYSEKGVDTMAMSYYPKEGNPLWERYSTEAIIHTIEEYNKYSLQYPYPVSISVNGPVGGMEYPMITFNGPRPTLDKKTGEKTYSRRTKYGLIGVIIHEVGHNYYPMIVNSDERQWTWMDEGLNSFVEYLAAQAWEENYPSRRGPARNITNYMKSSYQVPIMTNSESILQFGNNAYGKPATALNILRETIMGRELFDYAFKEYAERWKFKRPTPADFFRTMEDASAVDLDWFFRGWFYTTDHVDISLDKVTKMHVGNQDPEVEKAWDREQFNKEPMDISDMRNKDMKRRTHDKPELLDFYNENDKFTVTNSDRNKYNGSQKKLEDWQLELLKNGKNMYAVDFSNKGGLVMPIILKLVYTDGSDEVVRTSAQIWRKNTEKVSKLLVTDKEIASIELDPYWETADVDVNNNYWPQRAIESRLQLYKRKKSKSLMEKYNQKLKTDKDEKKDAEKTKKAA
ncbi:MAG: aminopeptidase, partial [Gammaproteobacteria bacterium MedPE]